MNWLYGRLTEEINQIDNAIAIAKTIAEINDIKNYNSKEKKTMSVIHANNDPHSEIVDYQYTGTTYKVTTLTFRDGTKTSVAAPVEKADPYTGFYTCFAKHMAGGKNKINNLAEYWIEKLPAKMKELEEQEQKDKAEQARLEERDKKRREEKRVRMEAIRRKEQYEAAKLAQEKYGVPMDFKCKCDNKN